MKYYNLPRLIEGFEETPLTTGFYDDRWTLLFNIAIESAKASQVHDPILGICHWFRWGCCHSHRQGRGWSAVQPAGKPLAKPLGSSRILWRVVWFMPVQLAWWFQASKTGWWFGTFFIFHFIYGMSSFPLTSIFFKMGRSTTNQKNVFLFNAFPHDPVAGESWDIQRHDFLMFYGDLSWEFMGSFMGFTGIYPLVNKHSYRKSPLK